MSITDISTGPRRQLDGWATLLVARCLDHTTFTTDEQHAFSLVLGSEKCLEDLERLVEDDARCTLIGVLLPAYVRAELLPAVAAGVEEHVAQCPLCATELSTLQQYTILASSSQLERHVAELALALFHAALRGVAGARDLLASWVGQYPRSLTINAVISAADKLGDPDVHEAVHALTRLEQSPDISGHDPVTARTALVPYADIMATDLVIIIGPNDPVAIDPSPIRTSMQLVLAMAAESAGGGWQISIYGPIRDDTTGEIGTGSIGQVHQNDRGPLMLYINLSALQAVLEKGRLRVVIRDPSGDTRTRMPWLLATPEVPLYRSYLIEERSVDLPIGTPGAALTEEEQVMLSECQFDVSWEDDPSGNGSQ